MLVNYKKKRVNWCNMGPLKSSGAGVGGLPLGLGVENLNTIAGCQSLLQQWGELLRELLPVLLPDLLLKAVQDLQEWAKEEH